MQPTIHSQAPAASAELLEEAFARHQSELLGTLFYMVGNADDAQDALQEAFVKCWKNVDQVAEVRNLRAWIFRIALNTGRDMRQTAWRRKRQSLPDTDAFAHGGQGPAAIAESKEEDQRLRLALYHLRDEEKEVFLLRQNGEMTYEEIGQAMGIPTGTVKTRMRLAIQRLREVLGNE